MPPRDLGQSLLLLAVCLMEKEPDKRPTEHESRWRHNCLAQQREQTQGISMYMTYSSKVHSDDPEQIGIQADLKLQNWTTAALVASQAYLGLKTAGSMSVPIETWSKCRRRFL